MLNAADAGNIDGPVVVVTAGDLRWLLGVELTDVPGLYVVDDPDTVAVVAANLAAAGHRVLIVRGRTGHLAAGSGGRRAGLTVVTAGVAPSLPSWQVHADGTVTAASARLAVLDAAAAAVIFAARQRATPTRTVPVRAAAVGTDTSGPADTPPAPAAAAGPRTARRLHIAVLGQVTLTCRAANGAVTPVAVRRTASLHLLLLLAIDRGGRTGDDLAAALWPEQPVRTGTRRFATSLSELRRTLQHATGVDVIRRVAAVAGGSSYRLDPAYVEVDLWQFHDLLDAADAATGATARRSLLQQAATLHRGEFAEGLTGAWLDPARETTARHCIDVFTYLAAGEPDHGAALALLHRATGLAPDNETVVRDVLRRHATAGDVDGVHRVYHALHERLAASGDTPQPATTRLYEELTAVGLAQPATAGAAVPERTLQ
ncbi:AfsR/SARP family transcriptional regulator [Dactylosporangium aurantiacum]|uniref:AfsR/SARP family transcriptional regulator n=1 Tax=Dactylosporangium aurantiacum TaxID=35754 RepID=UPI00138E3BDE|nr:bacterial transcriptional activator domain-containing protein [Dactylosporangium aurantiacum]MDG6107668.1 bacterial transcriptional activator domain-containing protein [Dactylosporangium aurantiacum]